MRMAGLCQFYWCTCRTQTCAHSGIEPSILAKGFLQGGPKVRKFFEFLTISSLYSVRSVSYIICRTQTCIICRTQTCAHSGIEPSILAKGFLQGGPKVRKISNFWPFLAFTSPSAVAYYATALGDAKKNRNGRRLSKPQHWYYVIHFLAHPVEPRGRWVQTHATFG